STMAVSVAIWSQDLEPNTRNLYTVENDVRITGASLAAELPDPTGRTVVEVVIKIPEDYELSDEEGDSSERPPMHKFVLCALTAGKLEQQPLDLVLPEGEEIEFVVKGKNMIHLYGNYIQQNPDEDDEDEDSDEDEFDLGSLPSDLEAEDDDELGDSSRFEEIQDTPASAKTGKRAREDEEMADASTVTAADTSATVSKKEKKRAKKLKNEAGKAAPAPAATETTETTTTT
ncbi:hypothetical protein LNV47_24730, partial [Paucibacter sp. DJ4R-1]|nr:hypothetical protein [Paucibacter sp. DJ4R-1]